MPTLKQPKQLTPVQAMTRLEDLCARAERCTYELRKKLLQWRIAPDEGDKIITSLQQRRFVDDERFTRAFVSDKVRFERRGRLYIRKALAAKRIPSATVSAVLADIDPDLYQSNLEYTLAVRLRQAPDLAATFEGRTKLFRYLLSRGYEPDLAARTLRNALTR